MKIDFTSNNLMTNQAINTLSKAAETKDFNQELENAMQSKNDTKLYDTCIELESVFLNQVLDAMQASISRSDFINRGFATETFESMLYEEYAKEISKTSSIGIAEMLYNQLKPK